MKTFLLSLSVLTLSLAVNNVVFAAEDVTGQVTIVFSPESAGGGVVETDLRQVGDQILGETSMPSNDLVNLTVNNGTYQGPTGHSLTSLKCTSSGCSGFINGIGVDLTNKNKTNKKGMNLIETGGTVNNNVYTEDYSPDEITIFAVNSITLKKVSDGKYEGECAIGMGTYTVTVTEKGSLSNFLADPALVAIFLGAPISHWGF